MTQSRPAHWEGNFYFRKESKDWRNNFDGKIVNASRNASKEELRRKAGKSRMYELNRSSNYGSDPMSKQKVKQAVKLFHQEKSPQSQRLFGGARKA